MKKILMLLPILAIAGAFAFSADKKVEEPKQEAASYKNIILYSNEPGGGGL
ncbi:hypothetical protein [Bacillus toyonensis]|uniref:hypothetical protein n=1 Tax=Bacillus toyonensis TaxID=155322 RepID=UPI0015941892|nr:hypothetical protein [Bacillus toyonensis]MBX0352165.1 hypothetical protein [Bacillus toyonensis]MDF9449892.1 hypothetical protein [Bacillus toyonensis]MDG1563731.1 hypothetical protein [Bacillus toyonensis]